MAALTATDRRLLSALQKNSRASITTLAGELEVSRATVQTSMERLMTSGAIQRFTIDMDPNTAGEMINAVMTISLQGNLADSVVRLLRKMPEIVSLHTTNGSWDLVANIETASLQNFDVVLRRVREIDGVLNSETSILLARA